MGAARVLQAGLLVGFALPRARTGATVSIRGALVRGLPWSILLMASASELCLVEWVLRVCDGPAPGVGRAGALLLALLGGNALWMRAGGAARRHRAFMLRPSFLWTSLLAGAAAIGLGLSLAFESLFLRVGTLGTWESAPFVFGAGGMAMGLGCLTYGLTRGQRRVRIERVPVRIRALPPELRGLRIAHITDLHIGPLLRAEQLRGLVQQVNATRPDLIALTGDLFDFDPRYVEEGCRELAKLAAPHGVFAVLGNHDVYTGADVVARGLSGLTSIKLLRDAWTEVRIGDTTLIVLGIDDGGRGLRDRGIESSALARLTADAPRDALRLLLVHRPNYLPQIARLGLPLALAGHTHGGQLSLPWPLDRANVARMLTPWTHGLHRLGPTQIYVSRGLGVGGVALRFNCPREIAVLTLGPE